MTNDRLVIKRILFNKVVGWGLMNKKKRHSNGLLSIYISEAMISIISREDVKPLDCNQDSIH